ncbi:MAG TPA: VWA domain-containing protein [Planctomycetes bacterium]|nr:VWA domain-containing protein [Planctomycetota bacterium]
MISILAPLVLVLLLLRQKKRRTRARMLPLLPGLSLVLLSLGYDLGPSAEPRAVDEGGDVLLCLDLSRSMLARDLPPDRLTRAKEVIRTLLEQGRQDRFGLVGFAGVARLLVPLTRDQASLGHVLEEANPLFLPKGGTDLGAALQTALDALVISEPRRSPCIVLLSDGEDHGDAGKTMAEQCRQRGIPVLCLGLGSRLGAKIPIRSEEGRESHLRDKQGREVVSRLLPRGLERIARLSGGVYYEDGGKAKGLDTLYQDAILAARRARRGSPVLGQVLALLGLLLLALFLARTPGGRA